MLRKFFGESVELCLTKMFWCLYQCWKSLLFVIHFCFFNFGGIFHQVVCQYLSNLWKFLDTIEISPCLFLQKVAFRRRSFVGLLSCYSSKSLVHWHVFLLAITFWFACTPIVFSIRFLSAFCLSNFLICSYIVLMSGRSDVRRHCYFFKRNANIFFICLECHFEMIDDYVWK